MDSIQDNTEIRKAEIGYTCIIPFLQFFVYERPKDWFA